MGGLILFCITMKSVVMQGDAVMHRPHQQHPPPPLRPVGARGVGEVLHPRQSIGVPP